MVEDNASSLTHTLAPLRPILGQPPRHRGLHQPPPGGVHPEL